jgi:lipoprotein-anchoring transpeptidase ErfK/SrfK
MAQRGRSEPARIVGFLTLMMSSTLLFACQSGGGSVETREDSGQGGIIAAQVGEASPPATITIAPADNRVNVPLDAAVKATVSGGTLSKITVTAANGAKVRGTLSERKTAWSTNAGFAPDAVYQVEATALNAEGEPTEVIQTFSTLKPSKELDTDIMPLEGSRVGVAMPITVKFDEPVANRAAVEKRLEVQTSKPVEGSWHWFSDEEVRYRPKAYWPAHTKVTVRAHMQGVRAGSGAWGLKDKVRRFGITNSVITKVNLADHQARVYIDGKLRRTIPVTGGMPGWRTRDGTKVILEKRENILFRNEAIGAAEHYRLTSRWGLRVTWSGEFLHTASWSTGSQGSANVSHGCVGMNTADSGWLWGVSHVGDPVEVHSPEGDPMEPSNGFGDWNFSWKDYKAGSALATQPVKAAVGSKQEKAGR